MLEGKKRLPLLIKTDTSSEEYFQIANNNFVSNQSVNGAGNN